MRLNEKLVQTLAFARLINPKNVGFYKGPLTWQRLKEQSKLKRKFHITVIGRSHYRHDFAPLTVYSMNTHFTQISVNLNTVTEKTDAIWINRQDPIKDTIKADLLEKCESTWRDKLILNHPNNYNTYHLDECFPRLEAGGVSVPRYTFTDADLGKTKVIYKKINQQASEKFICDYKGDVEGFRPFEFIDTANAENNFHRYRAFYAFGAVIPSIFIHSPSWNVGYLHETSRQVGFDMTDFEIEQMRRIAQAMEIDYFAVDFIRANNTSYFIDVNIYPTIQHRSFPKKKPYGLFHTFDFLKASDGKSAWEVTEVHLLKRLASK